MIGFSGNNQEIPVGTTGQDEIAVQIMDADGNPMSGVTVKFSVIDGSATLSPDKSVSNEKGIATTKAKAGNKTGAIDIKADVVGVSDLSTTFNLKAISKAPAAVKTPTVVPSPANTPRTVSTPIAPSTPQVDETPYIPDTIKLPSKTGGTSRTTYSREPANISVVAGNFQMSEPGVRLQQPVVVYVTDSDSNPTFATVSFTVMSGNATIINKEVQTDARGLASTFVVVNTTNPIKIVAEVVEKPGLSTIAFANTQKPEAKAKTEGNAPIIRSTTPSNTPGYPASIAFYDLKAKNTGNIEKTKVMQLEIGVSDFRNAPVSTAIKFTCLKGDIKVLTPIVQTTADGKGICYVEIAGSMGIFTIEAQSMENPDLRALFKSGPEIRTGPSPKVVRPGTEEPTSMETKEPAGGMTVKPPAGSGASGQPALVAVVQGGGQRAKIRSKLNDPIIILVTDADGKPVEGAHVSFYLKSGRAILSATMARTNGDGKAQISVTLGKTPGVCEIGVKVRENKDLDTTVHLEAIQ
ncbi:MAG: Ig-like domain-containing protein [Firmicutes bacterium]|nr:Ig-like domain-containing protein [Bacillota bacterium]